MIDAYYMGEINRMSPEAPVPIVSFNKKDHRPGGAANVALNLKSLGASVAICTVAGEDPEGHELKNLLAVEGIEVDGIFFDSQRPTTVKTRVIAAEKHLLRMDHESLEPINRELEEKILLHLESTLSGYDAVILEDYNKGMLTPRIIDKTLDLAETANVITVVDPKKDNFLRYKKCTLFKPNKKEIKEGLPTSNDLSDTFQLDQAAGELMSILGCKYIMITLSEDGVFIKSSTEYKHIKAHERIITDVSGAGDTVVSVTALALASGMNTGEVGELANLSGGLVCQKVGVVPLKLEELKSEVKRLNL